ncbi:hypothetical protein [Pseudanabaena sp. 'Roaring Creek']|uniref:hypothetical protein n=1 Tax=Pseudanabaena sp. 'Roaring Creek' TaxID=1681830 RepID=UPI0012E11FFE|nr:hypothetical protein [Pseudanabaena sp. 'Roaring Creek']
MAYNRLPCKILCCRCHYFSAIAYIDHLELVKRSLFMINISKSKGAILFPC